MTPQQAEAKLKRIAVQMQAAVEAGMAKSLAVIEKRAVVLSSGPYTTKQLRKMDHPYARRHAKPKRDPSKINVQTGAFRAAWKTLPPQLKGDMLAGSVYNTAAQAKALEQGTPTMVPRPIADRVFKETEKRVWREMERALLKSFR